MIVKTNLDFFGVKSDVRLADSNSVGFTFNSTSGLSPGVVLSLVTQDNRLFGGLLDVFKVSLNGSGDVLRFRSEIDGDKNVILRAETDFLSQFLNSADNLSSGTLLLHSLVLSNVEESVKFAFTSNILMLGKSLSEDLREDIDIFSREFNVVDFDDTFFL